MAVICILQCRYMIDHDETFEATQQTAALCTTHGKWCILDSI